MQSECKGVILAANNTSAKETPVHTIYSLSKTKPSVIFKNTQTPEAGTPAGVLVTIDDYKPLPFYQKGLKDLAAPTEQHLPAQGAALALLTQRFLPFLTLTLLSTCCK